MRGRRPPRVGVSASFFHPDRPWSPYRGKRLLYIEEATLTYLHGAGALAYMVPTWRPESAVEPATLATDLDALLLSGGDDVAPESYGETPRDPAWRGDALRDAYELALIRAFMGANKPVLGICRGAQILNVALGGTLYQDIPTQLDGAACHRDTELDDALTHQVTFAGHAAQLFGASRAAVNSFHHQGIKALGRGLTVEARCVSDGLVEAIRLSEPGAPWLVGVQWHPEWSAPGQLDPAPLIADFLGGVGVGETAGT